MNKSIAIGTDIGGSHISCAAVDLVSGKILKETLTERAVNNQAQASETIAVWDEAIMLTKISSRKFFIWTSILGILCLAAILLISSPFMAWGLVFLIGLSVANIFPLVFSITVERYPTRSNEISGLMMMAISGGAVIPLVIGWISDISNNVAIGMSILIVCMIYLLSVSVYSLKR
jgi:fucose permease